MQKEKYAALLQETKDLIFNILIPAEHFLDEGYVPPSVHQEMKKLGLFGLSIPEEFGGLGADIKQEISLMFEFGHTSPVFQFLIGTNQGIGSHFLLQAGSKEQKEKYLPLLAQGYLISSFALTEESAGSDASGIKSTATLTDAGWLLNGEKRYISNAPIAGLFTIVAKIKNKENAFAAFLVDASSPGLIIGEPDKKLGHNGAMTANVILKDCSVPQENLIGKIGEGLKIALQAIEKGRLIVSALSVGISERLLHDSIKYAKFRHQFGKPIGDFQLIKSMLADSYTETFAARSMVEKITNELVLGKASAEKIAACKYFTTEVVGKVADRALQIYGGKGYMSGNGIERFYRDVRLFRIYEGTNQIQQLIIAKEIIGNFTNIFGSPLEDK